MKKKGILWLVNFLKGFTVFSDKCFFSKSRLASEHVIVEGDKDDLSDRSSASLRLIKGNAIILELIESIFHKGVTVTVGDKRIPGK